ncbi:hypothetical protein C8R45DRAFT_1096277 [Mycena sanguinolenta]|nr:hypothetical protein C8R45DRAFT_1096277 [Mycena sanguinolenta]
MLSGVGLSSYYCYLRTRYADSRHSTVSNPCHTIPAFDWGATGSLYDVIDSASIPYNMPSSLIQQIVGARFLGGQPLPATSPCGGHNCSYLVSTYAPSYSCSVGAQNPSELNWTTLEISPMFMPPPCFAAQTDITTLVNENEFIRWDFQAHYTNYIRGHRPTTARGPDASKHQWRSWIFDDPLVHTTWYNAAASYKAILDSIAAYAIGSLATASSLAALNFTWIPIEDIPPIFESLVKNITLSILTGAADRSQSTTTCVYSDNNTHFVYNERRLWLIYGLGLCIALLCDFFGIIALFQNNAFRGATGSNFGDFLAGMRNEFERARTDQVDHEVWASHERRGKWHNLPKRVLAEAEVLLLLSSSAPLARHCMRPPESNAHRVKCTPSQLTHPPCQNLLIDWITPEQSASGPPPCL